MENLIYDRTISDITNKTAKGYYNYNDINRIEEWSGYLRDILKDEGYSVTFTIKTNWAYGNMPNNNEMERIRQNIKKLMDGFHSITPILEQADLVDYNRANNYEKILSELKGMYDGLTGYYVHSGVAKAGQGRFWQNRFRRSNLRVRPNNMIPDGKFANISSNYGTNTNATLVKNGNYATYTVLSNAGDYVWPIYAKKLLELKSGHTYLYAMRWRNNASYATDNGAFYIRGATSFDSSTALVKRGNFSDTSTSFHTSYTTFTINQDYYKVQVGIINKNNTTAGTNYDIEYQALVDITDYSAEDITWLENHLDDAIVFPSV